MRIETDVKLPPRPGLHARLPRWAKLQSTARAINRRMLDAERADRGTVLASPAFERIASRTSLGRCRSPARPAPGR